MRFERGQDPKKAMNIGNNREIKQGDRFYVFDHLTSTLVEVEALDDEMLVEELFPEVSPFNNNNNRYTIIRHYVPIILNSPEGRYRYGSMPATKKQGGEWEIRKPEVRKLLKKYM